MSFLIGVQAVSSAGRHGNTVGGGGGSVGGFFSPLSYGMVAENIHRSAMPEARHFSFLEALGIRSVVVLASEGPTPDVTEWAAMRRVQLWHPPSVQAGRGTSLSEHAVAEVLSVLLSDSTDLLPQPVLLTCSSGRYRTGVLVGCLRKVQKWSVSSILEEYRRFAEGRARVENEEFVENFDASLVLDTAQRVAAT